MDTHSPTRHLLGEADLAGRRVRCEAFGEFDTGHPDAYDLVVVAVDHAGLPAATKGARVLVESLAPGGTALTSVAMALYAGDPLAAAYGGPDPAVAAHAAEYQGLGCLTRIVELPGVTLVVATRLTE